MPRDEEDEERFPSRGRRSRVDNLSSTVSLLLDTNPTIQKSLVRQPRSTLDLVDDQIAHARAMDECMSLVQPEQLLS